jgi:hypothetical protein
MLQQHGAVSAAQRAVQQQPWWEMASRRRMTTAKEGAGFSSTNRNSRRCSIATITARLKRVREAANHAESVRRRPVPLVSQSPYLFKEQDFQCG